MIFRPFICSDEMPVFIYMRLLFLFALLKSNNLNYL